MDIKKIGLCIVVGLLFSGCMFTGLKRDVRQIEKAQTISVLVENESPLDKPVVLVLWALDDGANSSYWVMRGSSEIGIHRIKGRYYLMAYEDANEDVRYQASEYAGAYGAPAIIDFDCAEGVPPRIELRVLPPGEFKVPEELITLPRSEIDAKFAFKREQLGMITTMDNPLFTDKEAATGLWTLLKFVKKTGLRIYFLEEFDPEKIPVLFVHGVNGHPGNWKAICASLDQSQYQPWLVYYPSGFRLNEIGDALCQSLIELELIYKFEKLYVVAYSMGGLVSRAMLLKYAENEKRSKVPLYITISAPWAGHAAANLGVRYAPEVVPSWYDMVPESDFLRDLFKATLPDECNYYMFFSHKGDGRGSANNDGSVALSSQLRYAAQERAVRIFGVDQSHVGILSDRYTIEKINKLLQNADN